MVVFESVDRSGLRGLKLQSHPPYARPFGDTEIVVVSDGPLDLGAPEDSFRGLSKDEIHEKVWYICSLKMSFPLLPLRRYGDAGAVHEDDLPGPCLFLQEGRFQPVLVQGAGGVGDAAFIDVGDPSGIASDVDVRFGHVPFIALARGM
jgi:hypothetical protein